MLLHITRTGKSHIQVNWCMKWTNFTFIRLKPILHNGCKKKKILGKWQQQKQLPLRQTVAVDYKVAPPLSLLSSILLLKILSTALFWSYVQAFNIPPSPISRQQTQNSLYKRLCHVLSGGRPYVGVDSDPPLTVNATDCLQGWNARCFWQMGSDSVTVALHSCRNSP